MLPGAYNSVTPFRRKPPIWRSQTATAKRPPPPLLDERGWVIGRDGTLWRGAARWRPGRDFRARHGMTWNVTEDNYLLGAFQWGFSIEEIAEDHQRSLGGIRSRLKLLGVPPELYEPRIANVLQRQ